jgi:hypothetical protein
VRCVRQSPHLVAGVRPALFLVTLLIVGSLVLAACSDGPSMPPGDIDLYVATADTTIDGQAFLNITATVTNRGVGEVVYRTNCSIYTWFSAYDEHGNTLRLRDPSIGQVCPLEPSILDPWNTASAKMRFGHAWDSGGTMYRPAPGRYTLYTRFIYTEPNSTSEKRVDRRTVIDWE